jgi:hypothetical protein
MCVLLLAIVIIMLLLIGDQDYNNTVNLGSGNEFYHRGSSPYSTNAFMVGNQDITYQGGVEHKAESSCTADRALMYMLLEQVLLV